MAVKHSRNINMLCRFKSAATDNKKHFIRCNQANGKNTIAHLKQLYVKSKLRVERRQTMEHIDDMCTHIITAAVNDSDTSSTTIGQHDTER